MDIFQEIQNRAIDYKQVLDSCETNFVRGPFSLTDISIIVPVCGRTEFTKVLCDHFFKAMAYADDVSRENEPGYTGRSGSLEVSLTIVEHSDTPQHRNLCPHWVHHVWIPKNGKPFNKCLAHNVGALLTKEAQTFLFHDIDTIVPTDFFVRVLENLPGHDALQTFTKRRLQMCDHWLTQEIVRGNIDMRNITDYHGHFQEAKAGAMGGSIFIRKNLFFKTTFCAEVFDGYGLEDAFFWQCIDLMGRLGTCDNPKIELFHLFHEAHRVTKQIDWSFYNAFLALSTEEKKRFIQLMASNLNKHQHEA